MEQWTCYRDNRGCQYYTDEKPEPVETIADVIDLAERKRSSTR